MELFPLTCVLSAHDCALPLPPSYGRYERDRLARAKKIDKKKFGTLLDGTGLE